MELPAKLLSTVEQLSKIPGIGEKTAMRHALLLTKWNLSELSGFAQAIRDLGELEKCLDCGMLCDEEMCAICLRPSRRNDQLLCIVESVTDCLAIERGGNFTGLYHILGGVLNPLLGIGPSELKLHRIVERVRKYDIEGVILALNPSVEGDATCAYLKQILPEELEVDRIGLGIPMGGSLEYVDDLTITKAFENRRKVE